MAAPLLPDRPILSPVGQLLPKEGLRYVLSLSPHMNAKSLE